MTKIKPKKPNLVGSRWTLVVHGGTSPQLDNLVSFFETDEVPCAAVAYETGKQGVHPHWQVYFQTSERRRMKTAIEQVLGSPDFHLEVARGTKNANLKYVYAVNKEHQIGWVLYAKNAPEPVGFCRRKRDNLLWLRDHMKPWQREIHERVMAPSTFRDILWVWEPKGNTGKTYLAKYLHFFHGAILTGGKGADMKHAIARWKQITGHYPVTIIIDVARSDTVSADGYRTIQQMKNALFFSGKYDSGMVAAVNPPHIVVFSNVPPAWEHMSLDRWDVRRICEETGSLRPYPPPL